jgi:hypothetical protein
MHCSDDQCPHPAIAKVTYGLYSAYETGRPHHVDYLCEVHMWELWERANPLVQSLMMHFILEPIDGTG